MSSSENQVGFGFQTDVVSTANLAHLLTGRILKALSDGGVDLYAVTASIWLGKQLPFRSSLQDSVHATLAARSGTNGFLAKALSIGWGHTSIAVEMARTKAGTNALLLIGATVAGVPKFHAAQCLSELLTIYGCAADQTPSVDVLKSMAAYIGPMVQDLGFDRVLEHVTTSAAHAVARLDKRIPLDLTAMGTPQALASAVKQLIFTSQRHETIYFVPRQRGAWLAAFASHLLGMSVELVYGESVLWASGGDEGRVTLQMAPGNGHDTAITSRGRIEDFMLEPPNIQDSCPVDTEYLIPDALEGEIGRIRGMDPHLRREIHRAIARLSAGHINGGLPGWFRPDWFIFDSRQASFEALQSLRIEHDDSLGPECTKPRYPTSPQLQESHFTDQLGLYLDSSMARAIKCPHDPGEKVIEDLELPDSLEDRPWSESLERCKCTQVRQLIGRFALITYYLSRCRYDAATTRISRKGIRMIAHPWDERNRWDSHFGLFWYTCSVLFSNNDAQVTYSLMTNQDTVFRTPHVLGVSGGSTTVFYTSLLQNDCFDDLGRAITIASGRASVGGVLRNVIAEDSGKRRHELTYSQIDRVGMSTRLAPGTTIVPHYRPGPARIIMSASLAASFILVKTSADFNGKEYRHCLTDAQARLYGLEIPESCGHARDQGSVAYSNSDDSYRVSPFAPSKDYEENGADTWIYALQGHKLEQMLQVSEPSESILLQLSVCMRCAIRIAKEKKIRSIIMGG